MWYRKNVGGWERTARLIGGSLMLICGVVALHASPLGILLRAAGVVTLVTGVFGHCAACAIAGLKRGDCQLIGLGCINIATRRKPVPCGKRSLHWALPSSLRLRPAFLRGS